MYKSNSIFSVYARSLRAFSLSLLTGGDLYDLALPVDSSRTVVLGTSVVNTKLMVLSRRTELQVKRKERSKRRKACLGCAINLSSSLLHPRGPVQPVKGEDSMGGNSSVISFSSFA